MTIILASPPHPTNSITDGPERAAVFPFRIAMPPPAVGHVAEHAMGIGGASMAIHGPATVERLMEFNPRI